MRKSKKAKAFDLFSQGFTPSDDAVKALRLHKSNRYRYFSLWRKLGKPSGASRKGSLSTISSTKPSGETIGGFDETIAKPKAQTPKVQSEPPAPEEQIPLPGVEEEEPEPIWPKDIPLEKTKASVESIGEFSEVGPVKEKGDKSEGTEKKMATTIVEDGIKCTVLLSMQTLTLYSIAKSTQAQLGEIGDQELSLGDFLDTCAENFFSGRGKKLGLINLGGKKRMARPQKPY